MPADTAKVSDRRLLHFTNIDEALAEADRLLAADHAKRLRPLGNWTLGQALGHLAVWADYSYTGAPLKVPFFIRWMLRSRKNKFLFSPMRAGVKIPKVPGGTLGTADLPADDAAQRLRQAFDRLRREAPTVPNVIFGPLTHDEWIALNLRHAELHLGFFAPPEEQAAS